MNDLKFTKFLNNLDMEEMMKNKSIRKEIEKRASKIANKEEKEKDGRTQSSG